MPIDPTGIIPIGVVLMISSLVKRRRKRLRSKVVGPTNECPPFPWLSPQVDDAIQKGIEAEMCTLGELSSNVARAVYPETPDGREIDWPRVDPWILPPTEANAIHCLWDRIKIRVNAHLAVLEDTLCPDPGPGVKPSDVIGPWISPVPQVGRWYKIQSGDDLPAIARDLFNLNRGNPLIAHIIRCITASSWNLEYYGTPWDPDNKLFPFYTSVETSDGRMVISHAFMPRHEDAIAAMFEGRLPARTITPDGRGGSGTWGTIWIPDMTITKGGDLLCPSGEWGDGTSKSEPPPQALEVLEAA